MASIIKKVKGGKPYYYIAVSKRVDGKPRIVQQTYLGSVDRILATFNQETSAVPVHATPLELGLPGALWQAAQDAGVCDALDATWAPPRQGPALSHFLLLAAFHHVCNPGSDIGVADWYERTILRRLWDFPSESFSPQASWDRFDSINVSPIPPPGQPETDDELLAAQDRLLQGSRERNLVSECVVACDTSNFHTWIDSDSERSHSKQAHHEIRQVGLSYALDATHGLSLMHHVYPENIGTSSDLPESLERIAGRLDRAGIPRGNVTVTIEDGSAALDDMPALERSGLGWIAALPWHEAPPELRQRPLQHLAPVGSTHPGVQVAAERCIVHGSQRLCVLRHSETDAAEQLDSVSDSLAKALGKLLRLARDLAEPQRQLPTHERVHERVRNALGHNHVPDLVRYELTARDDHWELSFHDDPDALVRLHRERFGRTVLITNRDSWDATEVAAAYSRQQDVEGMSRELVEGGLAGWRPADPMTDRKLKVHAFYCMLGASLLHYLHRRAIAAGYPDLTLEQLCAELRDVRQLDLLYPPPSKRSKPSVVSVPSSQSETQRSLAQALGIDRLFPAAAAKGSR